MTFINSLRFNKKRKLPLILQDEIAECGYACVAMISNYFGHQITLQTIKKNGSASQNGVNLLEINNLLEYFGFRPRALSVPLEELVLVKCPAILHWKLNHFVVLKKIKNNSLIIHDPAYGVKRISLREASKFFTGIVVEIEKENNFQEIIEKNRLSLLQLFKSIEGVKPFLLMLIILSLTIEIFSLINPLFIQYVTDNVIGVDDKSNLFTLSMVFVIFACIHFFISYIRGNMVIYLTNNLTEQFSSNIITHLLKLPLEFFEKRRKGDIQSKFQSIDSIQKKISTDFVNTVLDGLMIVINLSVMLIYSWLLTILVVFSLSIYLLVRYGSYQYLKKETEASICQHAKAASLFLETLGGIVPIKLFSKEKSRFNIWRNAYINSLNADIKIAKANLLYGISSQFLFHLEHIVVICVGATLILSNQFSVGMLVAFLSYRLLLINKTSSFIQNLFDYQLISIQLNRLADILFHQPEAATNALPKSDSQGALALKKVFFRYNLNEKYVLENISLNISAGEKIAITGPSGCGKTSLLKVMMGLLPKTAGEIFIDDIQLEAFGLKNFRSITAAVMQEDSLLMGSIIDNISFFDEGVDIAKVYRVAKLASVHEVIMQLPMGYETIVGEMGSTLSGGQKQKLLLARALYKEPKILFLDEATSHLDVESEKNINLALKQLNITQIIIAHRQETIGMADRVITLRSLSS